MGSLYETPFPEGMIGCEWVEHDRLKLSSPLKGWLYFSYKNCGDIGTPVYGSKTRFFVNADNQLMIDRYPKPPDDHPHNLGGPSDILTLHDLSDLTETEFMEPFLTSNNPACEIGQTELGYWDIGYSESYLKEKGFKYPFTPEKSYETGFPFDERQIGLCSTILHSDFRQDVLRSNSNIGFQYDLYMIEQAYVVDPGSIVIRY